MERTIYSLDALQEEIQNITHAEEVNLLTLNYGQTIVATIYDSWGMNRFTFESSSLDEEISDYQITKYTYDSYNQERNYFVPMGTYAAMQMFMEKVLIA